MVNTRFELFLASPLKSEVCVCVCAKQGYPKNCEILFGFASHGSFSKWWIPLCYSKVLTGNQKEPSIFWDTLPPIRMEPDRDPAPLSGHLFFSRPHPPPRTSGSMCIGGRYPGSDTEGGEAPQRSRLPLARAASGQGMDRHTPLRRLKNS